MNNKTPKNLIVFAVFAFMLFGAQNALAYVPGVWDPQPRIVSNEPAFTVVPIAADKPFVVETKSTLATNTPTTTTTQNSNTSSNSTSTSTKTTNKTTDKNVATTSNKNTVSNLPPVVIDQGSSGFSTNANDLTALSFQGSGGFMPSSIWQWMLVVVFILIIIIIARLFKKHDTTHAAVY